MLIYFVSILVIIVLGLLLSGKKNKTFLKISFVILFLISGLRASTVGVDTHQFIKAFDIIKGMDLNQFSTLRYEYGFDFLCWGLGNLNFSSQSLIFISSLIICCSLYSFIRDNSDDYFFSVLLYIFGVYFFSYMNIMRQALALATVLIFYKYLKKEQNFKFIIGVILASYFHFSAILALIFIPLNKIKFKKATITCIMIIAIFLFIFGNELFNIISLFSSRLSHYIDGEFYTENYFGALIRFLISFFSLCLGVFIINKENKELFYKKGEISFYIGMMLVYNLFSILTMRVNIFSRFVPYFGIINIIWLPKVFSMIPNEKKRILYKFVIICIFVLYCACILIYRPEWNGVSNYDFYWNIK